MYTKTIQPLTSKVHYSTGDWDFEEPTLWTLDPSTYVTPPTCLKLTPKATNTKWAFLCRDGNNQLIPQGRIVTQVMSTPGLILTVDPFIVFRAQAPLGSASIANSYRVQMSYGGTSWKYSDPGKVDTQLGTFPWSATLTWQNVRVTWWNGKNLLNQPATVCRFEVQIGGVWTQQGTDLYDTNERNKASLTNRVGGGVTYYSILNPVRFDDTQIWQP